MPDGPDADGLLYPYGTWRSTGEPRFHLDLTRQFAIRDDGKYLQFHCAVQLAASDDLRSLGVYDEWWFRDDGAFDEWAPVLRAPQEWSLLEPLVPIALRLEVDGT